VKRLADPAQRILVSALFGPKALLRQASLLFGGKEAWDFYCLFSNSNVRHTAQSRLADSSIHTSCVVAVLRQSRIRRDRHEKKQKTWCNFNPECCIVICA
jgi:hypothetical protein